MGEASGSNERGDRPIRRVGMPRFLSFPWMETAIAPLTVAITGMMYLAGWTERNELLKEFGVSASIVPEPIQVTLGRGYIPLLAGLGVVGLTVALGWAIARTYRARQAKRSPAPTASPPENRAELRGTRRYLGLALAASVAMLLLLVGYVSGIVSAEIKASRAKAAVTDGCGRCFSYELGDRTHVGRILAQNDSRTVLLTRYGILLLDTEDISRVTDPDSPASERPDGVRNASVSGRQAKE